MAQDVKGFVASLMDFSFKEFVTTKLIKILYMLSILFAALTAILIMIGGFTKSIGEGFLSILLGFVVLTLIVLASRVWLELIIVVFRIAENTAVIAKTEEKEEKPEPAPPEEPKSRKTTSKKARKQTKKKTTKGD